MSTYTVIHEIPNILGVLGGTRTDTIEWTDAVLLKEGIYWHNGSSYTTIPWSRVVSIDSADTYQARFA